MNKIWTLFLVLLAQNLQANCPELDKDLAKKIDVNCTHVPKITETLKANYLKEAHDTANICWTTFKERSLSSLLEIRVLTLHPIADEDEYCFYEREDNTTYLYLMIDKETLGINTGKANKT